MADEERKNESENTPERLEEASTAEQEESQQRGEAEGSDTAQPEAQQQNQPEVQTLPEPWAFLKDIEPGTLSRSACISCYSLEEAMEGYTGVVHTMDKGVLPLYACVMSENLSALGCLADGKTLGQPTLDAMGNILLLAAFTRLVADYYYHHAHELVLAAMARLSFHVMVSGRHASLYPETLPKRAMVNALANILQWMRGKEEESDQGFVNLHAMLDKLKHPDGVTMEYHMKSLLNQAQLHGPYTPRSLSEALELGDYRAVEEFIFHCSRGDECLHAELDAACLMAARKANMHMMTKCIRLGARVTAESPGDVMVLQEMFEEADSLEEYTKTSRTFLQKSTLDAESSAEEKSSSQTSQKTSEQLSGMASEQSSGKARHESAQKACQQASKGSSPRQTPKRFSRACRRASLNPSPLHVALGTGRFDLHTFFSLNPDAKTGVVVNSNQYPKGEGFSLLHLAASRGPLKLRLDNVREVIQVHADVNALVCPFMPPRAHTQDVARRNPIPAPPPTALFEDLNCDQGTSGMLSHTQPPPYVRWESGPDSSRQPTPQAQKSSRKSSASDSTPAEVCSEGARSKPKRRVHFRSPEASPPSPPHSEERPQTDTPKAPRTPSKESPKQNSGSPSCPSSPEPEEATESERESRVYPDMTTVENLLMDTRPGNPEVVSTIVMECSRWRLRGVRWRTLDEGWSGVHLLARVGAVDVISSLALSRVNPGFSTRELRRGLTLIDTLVIYATRMASPEVALEALDKLLKGPDSLADHHAEVVSRRNPLDLSDLGPEHEGYAYAVVRLVRLEDPPSSYLPLVRRLCEAGAVCQREVQAVLEHLSSFDDTHKEIVEEVLRALELRP